MKTSLRTKLLGLLALSVGVAVVPFSLYTAGSLKEQYQESALGNIRSVSTLVADNLSSRYLAFLTGQVMDLMRQKENLKNISLFLSRNWSDLDTLDAAWRDYVIDNQVAHLSRIGLSVTKVGPDGRLTPPFDRFGRLDDLDSVYDFTGRSLKSRIWDNLAAEGEFVVFKAILEHRRQEAVFLAFVIPDAAGRNVIMAVSRLEDTTLTGSGGINSIISGLKSRFQELELGNQTGLSLLNGSGHVLAHHGPLENTLISHALLRRVRGESRLETVLDQGFNTGPTLVHIQYFKPLDWFIVLSVPEEAVSRPARAVSQQALILGAVIMALALLAGFYFTYRLIKPLKQLSVKALSLAEVDFSSPEAERTLTEGLPGPRGDEIGQLAKAFVQMGRTLINNIQALMAATTVKERLEGELGAAREIQMGILPPADFIPESDSFTFQAILRPAKEVGGDLYDYFTAPCGRKAVIIGDVSDKGVPAALFMAMTVTLVRQTMMGSSLGPAEAMTQVNDRLSNGNPGSMFVTLFIGLYDEKTGELEYANGGHCQPLVADGRGGLRALTGLSGPMVGALGGLTYTTCRDRLAPTEICLLYTDGITEAEDEAGGFFSQERLEEMVAANGGMSPTELNQYVFHQVVSFRGRADQSDDITLLTFTGRSRR